jgi:hypothetical protein
LNRGDRQLRDAPVVRLVSSVAICPDPTLDPTIASASEYGVKAMRLLFLKNEFPPVGGSTARRLTRS